MDPVNAAKTVEIFYSYHYKDEKLRQQLEKHLSILKRNKRISTWSSHKTQQGADRLQEINAHLNVADIILLLVSPDFLDSDYCYEVEVRRAIDRSQAGEAIVIPVILRPINWTETSFSHLVPLPTGGKPVTTWKNRELAFYDISLGIQDAAETLLAKYGIENTQHHFTPPLQIPQREDMVEQSSELRCDILLVTTTEVETQAVLDVFSPQNASFTRYHISDSIYFDLGVIGGARTFLIQSEISAGGPGGARLALYEGIKALSPSAVIMVGIAFGLVSKEQKLGDILVSRQLVGYELQKIEEGPDGTEIIRPRGDRVQASPHLLSLLRSSIFDWEGPRVQFGPMLSGEKLADHKDFRKKLLGIEPEAIGGEMEGTGIYAAASRNKVDWILVKAIADWADKDKDDTHQQPAAENAARFLLHVLQVGGLAGKDSHASSSSSDQRRDEEAPTPKRAQGTLLRTYFEHASWVLAVAWEPDGNRIASAGGDGMVRVWDANSRQTLLTYHEHTWLFEKVNWLPKIYRIAWSPEGLRIASAGDGRKVYVWDAATGQTITTYEGHSGVMSNVFAFAWSPDGKRIASACSTAGLDKTVHVWNAKTGSGILRYNSSYGMIPNFSVSSIAWSPNGDRIASACGDKTIRLWDAATGKHLSTFKTRAEWVNTVAWSPDGSRLALAKGDSIAEVINAGTGAVLLTYDRHRASVRDIAWSPDGTRLATCSNDSTVQIWDAVTGACLYTYDGHATWTTSVAWSPDGTRIASASNDKTVQVWQAV